MPTTTVGAPSPYCASRSSKSSLLYVYSMSSVPLRWNTVPTRKKKKREKTGSQDYDSFEGWATSYLSGKTGRAIRARTPNPVFDTLCLRCLFDISAGAPIWTYLSKLVIRPSVMLGHVPPFSTSLQNLCPFVDVPLLHLSESCKWLLMFRAPLRSTAFLPLSWLYVLQLILQETRAEHGVVFQL